jgi:DNA-directed RNA polymerase specialized sigma24 family protein
MKKQRRRRSKQVATVVRETGGELLDRLFPGKAEPIPVRATSNADGAPSVAALTDVLRALTDLPSDRAKARVLRFVQDYFDEKHGH